MTKEERIETKNEDGEVIYIHETFTERENLVMSGSFGNMGGEDDVSLTVHMNYDYENKHGTFEFYRTGSDDWYGSGSLSVDDNNELVDYDGVYSLMPFVLDWLQGVGVDVSYMRETLYPKRDTETSLLKAESKEEE